MLFIGRVALRVALPIWGFFVGFAFGAGLVAAWADESFLGTAFGWVLGLIFALIFAVLSYLYYWLAIVFAFGAFGFAIGSGIVTAIGIDWNWLAVLIGLAVGVVLGLVAAFANMPMFVMIVASSVAGAFGIVGGLMLLFGELNTSTFTRGDFAGAIDNSWVWTLIVVLFALAGILIQSVQHAILRSTVNEVWYAESV